MAPNQIFGVGATYTSLAVAMTLFHPSTKPTELKVLAGAAPKKTLHLVRRLLKWGAEGVAWLASELLGPRERFAFGILMYHRVTEEIAGVPSPTWNVTPKKFREQMVGLLKRGYEPWPLRRVLTYHDEHRFLPRKAFVVTFDDCYENVYLNAWPILQELKIPATLFLATAYLDSTVPFPSDDWSAAGQPGIPATAWRPITTQQCREMQESGLIELAAHTHTHSDFRGQPEQLKEDLARCLTELKERFGLKDATFAFPYGTKSLGFAGGELSQVAKEAGMLCALSTEPELVHQVDDPFEWGRFNAEPYYAASNLIARLNGWTSAVRNMGRLMFGRKPKINYLTAEQMDIALQQLSQSVDAYREQAIWGGPSPDALLSKNTNVLTAVKKEGR